MPRSHVQGCLAVAAVMAILVPGVQAQPVIFGVGTDLGYDTVYNGETVSVIFTVNANGAHVAGLGFPLGFTFSNGNIIGPVEEEPSSTTAEVRFSALARQIFENLALNHIMGSSFVDAPDDTLAVGTIDFGDEDWTGSGEVFRLVFTPLDTGSFTIYENLGVLPGPKSFYALDPTGTNLPVIWEDFDLSIPRRPGTVRVGVHTSYGHDSLYLGGRGSIIFTVDWAGHEISGISFPLRFDFSGANLIGPVSETPVGGAAGFTFSAYAQQVFENRPFNMPMGTDFTDNPDTLLFGALDWDGGGWVESEELARLYFEPADTGAIDVDTSFFMSGFQLVDTLAASLPVEWQAGAFTVVPCPVTMGDVNLDGPINSADAIYLVGHVFKGGPPPEPRRETGDVDCSGQVTSADIIYLVNYIFKGDEAPCGCYAGIL